MKVFIFFNSFIAGINYVISSLHMDISGTTLYRVYFLPHDVEHLVAISGFGAGN